MPTELLFDANTVAALLSAVAAAASAVAAFWSARAADHALQIQIEPSISIEFDNEVGTPRDRRLAVVTNESSCHIADLFIRVNIHPDPSNVTVMKTVASHDFRRWWRRKWAAGTKDELDCDLWFKHARDTIPLVSAENEKVTAGIVILEVSCRRAADRRKFDFAYVYRVTPDNHGRYFALPIKGQNPADAPKRMIIHSIHSKDSETERPNPQ